MEYLPCQSISLNVSMVHVYFNLKIMIKSLVSFESKTVAPK